MPQYVAGTSQPVAVLYAKEYWPLQSTSDWHRCNFSKFYAFPLLVLGKCMADYERIKPGARTPWDAVVVEVTESFGRSVGDVSAVEEIASFPVPVRQALVQAEALREKLALKRIVIRIGDDKLWNPAWGGLV